MDSHRGGQSQRWTVTEVDSHRGGQSQRWTVTEVDSHRGGQSQRWTVMQMGSHIHKVDTLVFIGLCMCPGIYCVYPVVCIINGIY